MKRLLGALAALLITGFVTAPGIASAHGTRAASRLSSAGSVTLDAAQLPQVTYTPATVNVSLTVHTAYVTVRITSADWAVYTGQKVWLVYDWFHTGTKIGNTSYTRGSACTMSSHCTWTFTLFGYTDDCFPAGSYVLKAWGYSAKGKTTPAKQKSNTAESTWKYSTRRCL